MTSNTKLLLPHASRRARRQMEEWKWIVWFLTIGWWYLPVVAVTWICWELAKIVILGTVWLVSTIKVVIEDYATRSR